MPDESQMVIIASDVSMDVFQKEFSFYYKNLCGREMVSQQIKLPGDGLVKIVLSIEDKFIQKLRAG